MGLFLVLMRGLIRVNYKILPDLKKLQILDIMRGKLCLLFLISSVGLFGQTVFWSENFNTYADGSENGTASGAQATNWSTTLTGDVWVQGGRIEANNLGTEGIWLTDPIDISLYTGVNFSLDVATMSNTDQFEAGSDYFIGEYRIDGSGGWVQFENASGDGNPFDPLNSSYAVSLPTTGSTLEIRVRFYNTAGNEYYYIDNVQVEGSPSGCSNTLDYEFYDSVPTGNTVDNIPTTGALSTGTVSNFDVDALQNAVDPGDTNSFSIRYTGYIEIQTAGSYTFYTSSDDGSKLFIDGVEIVDNDGNHGNQERSGTVSLDTGLYPIEVLFYENSGGETLTVQYQGPSISKQNIPFSRLYATCSGSGIDTDGDGINDDSDIDDDNDGIVDADECGATTGGFVQTATSVSYFSNTSDAGGDPGTSYAANPTTWPGGTSYLLLDFGTLVAIGTTVDVYIGADPAVSDSDMQVQRTNSSGTTNDGYLADGNNTTPGSIRQVSFTITGTAVRYIRVVAWNQGARVYGAQYGGGGCSDLDTDSDGIPNRLDLDSDSDGIPDNVEAQDSNSYIAPSGLDANSDGLDDAYGPTGISTQDWDGDTTPDFLDTDSDDDATGDVIESGLSISNSDSDNDGLDDAVDATSGYSDPAGTVDDPTSSPVRLTDVDMDVGSGGDLDYRDISVTNDPPTLTVTGDQNYCPLTSQPIVESISITDPDDTTTTGVYIQISGNYVNGEDLLTLTGSHPGITASWDATEGELTLLGPASYSDFEAAILNVEFSSTSPSPTGTRSFSITVGEANYLPSTGHYYLYVEDLGITWTDANAAASASTYFGLQGYLATLTSQAEADFSGTQAAGTGWIGGSDAATEGTWEWVTGPEAGTVFWNGTAGGSSPNFAFWNNAEPNQSGDEDYAHITHPNVNPNGSWNDLSNTGAASGNYQPQGYVVEYGGMPGDPVLNITGVTTLTMLATPTVNTQSTNRSICPNTDASFSVTTSGANAFQWQVFSGGSWADLTDDTTYAGTSTETLSISAATLAMNGNQYRLHLIGCADNYSNTVTLTVEDVTNPTASNPAGLIMYCNAEVPVPDINVVTDEADNCTVNPLVTFIGEASDGGTNPEIITRTYRISDNQGNSIDVTQTITINHITITSQPSDLQVFVGANATFSVTTTNVDTYQWQVSTDSGGTFNNIFDGADYIGTTSNTMTVVQPGIAKNGYLYRILVSNSGSGGCVPLNSGNALLSVKPATVITNRRITIRVDKQ